MRNMIKAALIIGTLATPMISMADEPKKDAPAAKEEHKDAAAKDAPKADAKAPAKKDAAKKDAKKDAAKDAKEPAAK